jgi:hypothetical protein
VVTAQSVAADLARAFAGRRAETPARRATEAVMTTGLICAGTVLERLLPARPGERVRRAVLRTMGHRATLVGTASLIVGAIAAADEHAAGRGHLTGPARVLGSAGARIVGVGIASWSISRYHRTEDPGVLPPPVDPLMGALGMPASGGEELLHIERVLRRREAEWAERRMVAEQMQR